MVMVGGRDVHGRVDRGAIMTNYGLEPDHWKMDRSEKPQAPRAALV